MHPGLQLDFSSCVVYKFANYKVASSVRTIEGFRGTSG